jgi:AcrR family transcriptional regulator
LSEAPTQGGTRRERHRQATLAEIIAAARELVTEPGGFTLRSVALRLGMTAPALYRYVANFQELVDLVALDIDRETAAGLRQARDTQPADDPVAQLISSGAAFRRWALAHREEFSLVFANPATSEREDPSCARDQETGRVFTDLIFAIWQRYRFPLPDIESLDPDVVAVLEDPFIPADLTVLPPEAKTLPWVYMQSWVEFYGTVTLEVFGHCDPRLLSSGALFRAMLINQAERMGITAELPRLLPLAEAELGRV